MIRIMKESLATPPAEPWSVEESVLDLLELLTGATAGTAGAYLLTSREFIRTRLHEADLSVPRIARAVGVSERHLARIFAAEGSNVSKEILQARLGRASDMLADKRFRDTSIGAIAASVGFASAAHFSRAFRQTYGRTPPGGSGGLKPPPDLTESDMPVACFRHRVASIPPRARLRRRSRLRGKPEGN